jgi:D-lactate dehydrogenase (cytochrome)
MKKFASEAISEEYTLYLKDESRLPGQAEKIFFPVNQAQVEDALRCAQNSGTPLTAQGSRTGINGAAAPAAGGVLNLSKMRSITGLSRDKDGVFYVTLEPGVLLSELQERLARKNFDVDAWTSESREVCGQLREAPRMTFPPDPTESTASLGGMFACDAQGLCACRYGSTAKHVREVTVALADGQSWNVQRGKYCFDAQGVTLPDGRRLETPSFETAVCRCLLPREGMDLVDFLAASEGMLGVVTSLTLRLEPAFTERWGILFFFSDFMKALDFSLSFSSSFSLNFPSNFSLNFSQSAVAADNDFSGIEAVELFDRASLDLVMEAKLGGTSPRLPDFSLDGETSSGGIAAREAAVYIQLAGNNAGEVQDTLLALADMFASLGGRESDALVAEGDREVEKFRLFRHAVPEFANTRIDQIRRVCPDVHKMAVDFTVPLPRMRETAVMYREGMKKSGVSGAIFGHAAIGRLHVNFFPENTAQLQRTRALMNEWAARAVAMGGRLADENGVGKTKRFMILNHVPAIQLQTMRRVKEFFDPRGLLNPGNMF